MRRWTMNGPRIVGEVLGHACVRAWGGGGGGGHGSRGVVRLTTQT
jgi:hypothetical protein